MSVHIDTPGVVQRIGSRLPLSSAGLFIVTFSGLVMMRVACG